MLAFPDEKFVSYQYSSRTIQNKSFKHRTTLKQIISTSHFTSWSHTWQLHRVLCNSSGYTRSASHGLAYLGLKRKMKTGLLSSLQTSRSGSDLGRHWFACAQGSVGRALVFHSNQYCSCNSANSQPLGVACWKTSIQFILTDGPSWLNWC